MDKNLKTTIIIVASIAAVLLILVIPVKRTYTDGGTVMYSALTYKKIVWNVRHAYNNTYRTGEEIHFFPGNFKSYEDYYMPEKTVRLDYESTPIWIYITDSTGEEAHKVTNGELLTAIMEPLNGATYTYLSMAADDEAVISLSVGDVERTTVNFAIKDAYTIVLDGYLYQSDIELPYNLLCEIFANN